MKWGEEVERTIALHLYSAYIILFLTFIIGLIGLFPHLKIYDGISFFFLTIPLCLIYLGFAAGAAYSVVRIALWQALIFKWRKQMAKNKKLNFPSIPSWYIKYMFSPWWEKMLFDKMGNLRKRFIYFGGGLTFAFWLCLLVGKLLT